MPTWKINALELAILLLALIGLGYAMGYGDARRAWVNLLPCGGCYCDASSVGVEASQCQCKCLAPQSPPSGASPQTRLSPS
jgi:hypothetical protein